MQPLTELNQMADARARTDEALRQAALAVSGARGADIFPALVRYLGTTLGVDYAFIALPLPERPERLRTVAMFAHGQIAEPIEYDLSGSPCETVLGQQFRFIPRDAHRLFPGDSMLTQVGIEGYAAVPLFDSAARSIGLMAVLHGRPLADPALAESMLRIFSTRAAAELERAQAEAAHRRSEESYRTIFEACEDAIFVHDWDSGAILDVNPKACATYGYTCEEFRGLSVADISSGEHPYTLAEAAKIIERAKRGEMVCVEWHRRNKDGSLHWDEVYLRAATIAGEKRVLAFTREITERKKREQALSRSESQLRATVEAALDCVIAMDGDGNVTEFNRAAEECFGWRREQVIGKPLVDFVIPPARREIHRQRMQSYRATGANPFPRQRMEVEVTRADGTVFPVELAVAVAAAGDSELFIGFLRDITEQKRAEAGRAQLEAQLRQAQKMEAIGHLSGGIAHDFNNILTTIMGYIAMAQERLGTKADEKLSRYLERALRSGRQARDLIQQLLTFSRGQRGEARALRLGPLVKESVRMLRSTLPSSVEFETEIAESLPAVRLDPVQLEQILMNLCINARDAMDGAGRLRIELAAVERRDAVCTSCRQPVAGSFVELSVSDSGPGIGAAVIDRMFEPFFTTKEPGKGSGMGLAVVHGIVHEHGGHIVAESVPVEGATFRVLFPLAAAKADTPSTAESAAAAMTRRLAGRVLVVDDEPAVAEFMGELLSNWGLEVMVEQNSSDAKALVLRDPQRFDLVVTDQTMPRLTGLELARALAAARPDLPVVLYTGYSERLTEQQVRDCGIRVLVTKPIDIDALFLSLSGILKTG